MVSTSSPPIMALLPTTLILLLFLFLDITTSPPPAVAAAARAEPPPPPTPAPWPHQFHSILFMNYSGALSLIDLWYDWPNGRNFNIMQDQLKEQIVYDLEWNNGTSFLYTLDASRKCRTIYPGVGILRPNWLDGAEYLGQQHVNGFLCNVWQKVDFIWYYEDVVTKRPVHWVFYTGRSAHVMTFEVGAVLEDAKWQAPVYCFEKGGGEQAPAETQPRLVGGGSGGIRAPEGELGGFLSSLM